MFLFLTIAFLIGGCDKYDDSDTGRDNYITDFLFPEAISFCKAKDGNPRFRLIGRTVENKMPRLIVRRGNYHFLFQMVFDPIEMGALGGFGCPVLIDWGQ